MELELILRMGVEFFELGVVFLLETGSYKVNLTTNFHDALLSDIPQEALHVRVTHLMEEIHIAPDLLFMGVAVNSSLVIDDEGLIAVGNHTVRPAC